MPDGKVTICEELYWHPHFIIGDLKKQTLKEIWNSQKAKDIFILNSLPYLRIVHVLRVKTFLNAENISIFVGEIRFWHMALINGIIQTSRAQKLPT